MKVIIPDTVHGFHSVCTPRTDISIIGQHICKGSAQLGKVIRDYS